ncbi:hypothetical protein [Streptomyces purpureus]|uniref:hypothetical protein n=1 Tax=Streptomyces purpureus TaxID=1951 RepID=UPI0003659D0F|nr:hypothetical protein [Streptomyces purpureus]
MRVQRVTTATAVVALAMSGLSVFGGAAFADGRGATATGGSSGTDLFQQNTAQEARQNNNCANANKTDSFVSLVGGRVDGRCVTADGSLNQHAFTRNGPAKVEGGSGLGSVSQQNTAQRGRQNNNCNQAIATDIGLTGGESGSDCIDRDESRNKHTYTEGGGAVVEGSSSEAGVLQQTTAQEGRQNNNCANQNGNDLGLTGGRSVGRCENADESLSTHTLHRGGGAVVEGGSGVVGVSEQNTAQEGRQNNNCLNSSDAVAQLIGGREEGRCGNEDVSVSKHTLHQGGGARADGGSDTSVIDQQTTAQEGRQNNNCAHDNFAFTEAIGNRAEGRCENKDASFDEGTLVKGGGAHAQGGTGRSTDHQITAQEGRQNNNCANDSVTNADVSGGRVRSLCANDDQSVNKGTVVKGGGAQAASGSGTDILDQQTTAQEGRQNNNCANQNGTVSGLTGARIDTRCRNHDGSFNRETFVKGGGARAEGGSSLGDITQQNVAQEGRQNNNCANPNGSSVELTGGRHEVDCTTVDESANVGTTDIGQGAETEGGSSLLGLSQQNTAQEGRQNNNCANPNNLTVTGTGSRSTTQCLAIDRSRNIDSHTR